MISTLQKHLQYALLSLVGPSSSFRIGSHIGSDTIVSHRGTQFTSKFWNQLHETLGTRLEFSTAFHPQTDGQTERVNQILEDMLRACALDYGSSWDDNLPYAEFSYKTVTKPV